MKISVVSYRDRRIRHDKFGCQELADYCDKKRNDLYSKCKEHYERLFYEDGREQAYVRCPYGLVTTMPIGGGESLKVLSGFWLDGVGGDVPAAIKKICAVSRDDVDSLVTLLEEVVEETQEYDSAILEAAIHDVRHLNHSLTLHAERLLSNMGFSPTAEWDLSRTHSDENLRRAVSIFVASRDLSEALSLHEIARSPKTALVDKEPIEIHKAFYAQKKVAYDRLEKKGLTLQLTSTHKSLLLTKSFKLLPKILIDNAIKYAERNTNIEVRFYEARGMFKIECKNYGPLVRDGKLEEVFGRGVRGCNRAGIEGHGLGLWLARLIVEANQGTINMEANCVTRDFSGRNIGHTTITVTLLDQFMK